MMRRLTGVTIATLFSGGVILNCASCASLSSQAPTAAAKPVVLQLTHWKQVSFGTDARFAICVEPECPRVTPKTVAQAPAPMPVVAAKSGPVQLRPAAACSDDAPAAQNTSDSPAVARPLIERNVVINFPLGSAELTAEGKARIRDSVQLAKQADRIVISGRTDALGGDKLNESLALARAITVRNYFRDLAPDLSATFAIDAKGRCCFIAGNDHEAGRSRNRRVEIHLSSEGGA